jgi:WD40 repeat protein
LVAAGQTRIVTGGADGFLRAWDVRTERPPLFSVAAKSPPHPSAVCAITSIVHIPGSHRFVVLTASKECCLWDITSSSATMLGNLSLQMGNYNGSATQENYRFFTSIYRVASSFPIADSSAACANIFAITTDIHINTHVGGVWNEACFTTVSSPQTLPLAATVPYANIEVPNVPPISVANIVVAAYGENVEVLDFANGPLGTYGRTRQHKAHVPVRIIVGAHIDHITAILAVPSSCHGMLVIAAADKHGDIRLWDVSKQGQILCFGPESHSGEVTSLALMVHSPVLASGGKDRHNTHAGP